MTTEQVPQTLPIPANFPVKWDTPEEAAVLDGPHALATASRTCQQHGRRRSGAG
jgi:hypothetical protein